QACNQIFIQGFKMIKKIIIGMSALLITTHVFAQRTEGGKIDSLNVGNYWTQVHINGGNLKVNKNICGNKSETPQFFAIEPSHPNYETLHSTLLAAQLGNKTVKLLTNGCAGQNGNYPRIVGIWVTD
ncbi:hypothetical protein C3B51_22060, partial [Pseudoalteromonas rubra]